MMKSTVKPRQLSVALLNLDSDGRYDIGSEREFDFATREKPHDSQFAIYDHFVEGKALKAVGGALKPAEGVVLANINLQMRGLTGIVLGSTIRDLYAPPENIADLGKHRDLDVLILQPHSHKNPAPHEWGMDWWVRPDTYPPTNGRAHLNYDLSLKHDISVSKEETQQPGIVLNTATGDIRYAASNGDRDALARSIADGENIETIPSGLYLPDSKTVGKIIRHCNTRARSLLMELAELKKIISDFSKNYTQFLVELRKREVGEEKYERCLGFVLTYAMQTRARLDSVEISLGQMPSVTDLMTFIEKIGGASIDRLREKIEGLLETQHTSITQGMKRADATPSGYDYLSLRGLKKRNPLLPILPDALLTFRPY